MTLGIEEIFFWYNCRMENLVIDEMKFFLIRESNIWNNVYLIDLYLHQSRDVLLVYNFASLLRSSDRWFCEEENMRKCLDERITGGTGDTALIVTIP